MDEQMTPLQKWCQPHWDRLRNRLIERGMGDYIAKGGKAAGMQMVNELDGKAIDACGFDPLIRAWSMINLNAMERNFPIYECPVCVVAKHKTKCIEKKCGWPKWEEWMDECIEHLRGYMISLKLIKGDDDTTQSQN